MRLCVCSVLLALSLLEFCGAADYYLVGLWDHDIQEEMQNAVDWEKESLKTCLKSNTVKFISFDSTKLVKEYHYSKKIFKDLSSKNVLALGGDLSPISKIIGNELKTGLPANVKRTKPIEIAMPPMTMTYAADIMAHLLTYLDVLSRKTTLFIDLSWGTVKELNHLLHKLSTVVNPVFFSGNFPDQIIFDMMYRDRDKAMQYIAFIKPSNLKVFIKYLNKFGFFEPTFKWFFFVSDLQNVNETEIYNLFTTPNEYITLVEINNYYNISGNVTRVQSASSSMVKDLTQILMRYFEAWVCGDTIPEEGDTLPGITGSFHIQQKKQERIMWQMNVFQGVGRNHSKWAGDLYLVVNEIHTVNSTYITKINISRPAILKEDLRQHLSVRGMKLIAVLEPPFVFWKENRTTTDPVLDQLDGISIVAVKEICRRLNTKCTMDIQTDGIYGDVDSTKLKDWSGVMRKLIMHEMDLAVGSLSIDETRNKMASPLVTMMSYQLSILMKDPGHGRNVIKNMFQFIQPLDKLIWITVLVSVVAVSIVLMLFDCVMPNSNRFHLYDSIFFSGSSLVMGATISLPDRVSGRIVVAFFWFFTIIFFLFYICNYSSMQLDTRMAAKIVRLRDLKMQKKLLYGTVANSNVDAKLRNSASEDVQAIYQNILNNQLLWNSSTFAVEVIRSKDEPHALIYDDPVNMFYRYQHCDLKAVAQHSIQDYSFYTQLDFIYIDVINDVVSDLIKERFFAKLYNIYVHQANETNPKCIAKKYWWGKMADYLFEDTFEKGMSLDPYALTLEHTAGIFMIMLGGAILAMILAVFERIFLAIYTICKRIRKARKAKRPTLRQRRNSLETEI